MIQNEKNSCIICKKNISGKRLFTLFDMPASAQDIPDQDAIDQEVGIELNLCQCDQCGLVQFDCAPVDYYKDVIRSGGFSTTMVELRRKQYTYLIEKYCLQGKKFIEIGCGQGEFIKTLTEFDVDVYGIEHREQLVNQAKDMGLKVWRDFAESKSTCLQNPYDVDKYDVFLSFNFLEHQPYPKEMLECIYEHLSDDGMGLITVPSLEYILEHDGYYELIRDHLAYYTFNTLECLLNSAGFEILEKETINRDTISVIVRKSKKDNNIFEQVEVSEINIAGLKKSIGVINAEVEELLVELDNSNLSIAMWGASHQGFTLAATTKLKDKVKYIIDSAPFKQNKYAPASHIPIVALDYYFTNPVDWILIVAPGYTKEIADIIRERFGEHVKVLMLQSKHIEEYVF